MQTKYHETLAGRHLLSGIRDGDLHTKPPLIARQYKKTPRKKRIERYRKDRLERLRKKRGDLRRDGLGLYSRSAHSADSSHRGDPVRLAGGLRGADGDAIAAAGDAEEAHELTQEWAAAEKKPDLTARALRAERRA